VSGGQGLGVRDSGFVGRTRGNSNIQSSPEEKAMMDTYNLSEFGSFRRARQIAVTLLFALTLAGPSRLWGQCQPVVPRTNARRPAPNWRNPPQMHLT